MKTAVKTLKNALIAMFVSVFLGACGTGTVDTPPDTKYLSEFNTTYFGKNALSEDQAALYVDYSTCIALGQNSAFFKTLTPSFVTMTRTYYAIQGDSINEMQGNTYTLLKSIEERNYANLQKAAEQIVSGNREAILLTDGEFFQPSIAKSHVNDPYMADAFKKWLLKGHDIHILIEPYEEAFKNKVYDKKRYYIFFTDDRMENNIFKRVSETYSTEEYPQISEYHLSIQHPAIEFEKNNASETNENLAATTQGFGSYEIQEWNTDWKTIENLSMGGDNETLIEGIKLNPDMGGLHIKSLAVKVYDLNSAYADFYNNKEAGTPAGTQTPALEETTQFLTVDNKEFGSDKDVEISFDKAFNTSLLDGKPFNYFKIDLCIGDVENDFNRYSQLFEFPSIDAEGQTNTSMSESIRQCLLDPDIQNALKSAPIYSIYVKSNKF